MNPLHTSGEADGDDISFDDSKPTDDDPRDIIPVGPTQIVTQEHEAILRTLAIELMELDHYAPPPDDARGKQRENLHGKAKSQSTSGISEFTNVTATKENTTKREAESNAITATNATSTAQDPKNKSKATSKKKNIAQKAESPQQTESPPRQHKRTLEAQSDHKLHKKRKPES